MSKNGATDGGSRLPESAKLLDFPKDKTLADFQIFQNSVSDRVREVEKGKFLKSDAKQNINSNNSDGKNVKIANCKISDFPENSENFEKFRNNVAKHAKHSQIMTSESRKYSEIQKPHCQNM